MNDEIKRLLKLSNIPGFELLPEEKQQLEEWKRAQKKVKAPRKKKTAEKPAVERQETAPAEVLEPNMVDEPSDDVVRVKNVVKADYKEFGTISES